MQTPQRGFSLGDGPGNGTDLGAIYLMKKWWIGCSGFHYKNWKNVFYPKDLPQRRWFEFYCEHFNTVELNVTFYRFPREADLKRWYTRSPHDFRFTVKAPRLITHFKRFNNAKREIHDFYDTVAKGLKDKLGPILYQLHPGIKYSAEGLERILSNLDPAFVNVIEFRHESWWRTQVVKELRSASVAFCGISYPGLPENVHKTSSSVYYRFHGVPEIYRSSYRRQQLKAVVEKIRSMQKIEDAYLYFNNDIEAAAVKNARTVQKMK